jgi:glycosyltransferase involved in cell wall biosynthesis
MRVAHVVLSLDVGGLERVIIELVREGHQLGQEVSVICLERRGLLADQVEAAGGRVIALAKRPGLKPGMVGEIGAVLGELRPDVVHTHQIGALVYAGPAARRLGIRAVVHTEHTNNLSMPTSRGRRLRMRVLWWYAARYAARFLCVSEDIAVAARAVVAAERVGVVTNGIDTAAFGHKGDRTWVRQQLGIPLDAAVVGTLGRLNEVKCQDVLIRAFAVVRGQIRTAHLLLIGDGPQRVALETLVSELALTDCVHFAGYQSRPQCFLQAIDVFALPSRLEGMPLAVLEAWAAHVPVIASRVGGVPKVVRDGETGILFESGDQRGLEAAILRILSDDDEAKRYADAGLVRVLSEFDSRSMARNYRSQYLRVLEESSGRVR